MIRGRKTVAASLFTRKANEGLTKKRAGKNINFLRQLTSFVLMFCSKQRRWKGRRAWEGGGFSLSLPPAFVHFSDGSLVLRCQPRTCGHDVLTVDGRGLEVQTLESLLRQEGQHLASARVLVITYIHRKVSIFRAHQHTELTRCRELKRTEQQISSSCISHLA